MKWQREKRMTILKYKVNLKKSTIYKLNLWNAIIKKSTRQYFCRTDFVEGGLLVVKKLPHNFKFNPAGSILNFLLNFCSYYEVVN